MDIKFNKFGLFGVSDTDDGDMKEMANLRALRDKLNLKSIAFMKQIHSNTIKFITNSQTMDKMKKISDCEVVEFTGESEFCVGECDGIITNLSGVGLVAFSADCPSVMIMSRNLVGIAHSGRVGTMRHIAKELLNLMVKLGGDDEYFASIGVGIKRSCYEVNGVDMSGFDEFMSGGKFDINAVIKDDLKELGGIFEFSHCSHCDKKFYSYRRDKTKKRFVGVVGRA